MYTGLAATWGLLALCVLSGDRGDSVGYGHTEIIGAVDYLRTQMVAITRYLRLSALADDFVFDYFGQGVVRSWSAVAVETVVLGLWLAASLLGLFKRSTLGLLSLCFFALLAPTSSVIPLAGELIGEHRMYLPLVPLVAIAALVMYRWIEPLVTWRPWLGPLFVLLAASPAAWRTVERNADYRTRVTLWQDTVEKRPENSRAWSHLATALKNEGRLQEAEPAYLRALELDPRDGKTSYNYGNVLFERGDLAGALERYRVAALHDGDDPNIRFNLGYALVASGDLRAGLAEYRAALELRPGWERPQMLLAWTLATAPDASVRDGREALRLARALNEASGNRLPRHLDTLAAALAETGEFELAQDAARRAVAGARAAGNVAAAREIEQRLHLYEARLPFRSG
jgi:tetratricopeptide (TPR) repeat protein